MAGGTSEAGACPVLAVVATPYDLGVWLFINGLHQHL
jgi:hypothetical protein